MPQLSALNALIKNIRENPFATFMAVIIMIATGAAFQNATKLDALMPLSDDEQMALSQKQDVSDQQIKNELERTREKLGGARILVRQYHNGLLSADKRHLRRVSTTHYSVRRGVSNPNLEPYPFSSIAPTVALMHPEYAPPKCILMRTDEIESSQSYDEYLRAHGVELFAMCPIMDFSQTIRIGFVGIGFLTPANQKLSDDLTMKELEKTALRIGGYLKEVQLDEDKPWWALL